MRWPNRFSGVKAICLTVACLILIASGTASAEVQPKYIFLFIGDGMGVVQREAAEAFVRGLPEGHKLARKDGLVMNSLPVKGMAKTRSLGGRVTDSAAAATSLACGVKTRNGVLGLDGRYKPAKPVTKYATEANMKTGLISSVTINHATPAGFYAAVRSRNNYNAIAKQIPTSGVDYFAGGGLSWRAANDPKLNIYHKIASAGYKLAFDRKQLLATKPGDKVFAQYAPGGGAMPYQIDLQNRPQPNRASLADFVKQGIAVLDNPGGFFMMVEGGKIDWSCHSNDAGGSIMETIAFDDAVRVAMNFYKKHPNNTLIIVTADHETGELSKLNATKPLKSKTVANTFKSQKVSVDHLVGVFKPLAKQKASFAKVKALMMSKMGWTSLNSRDTRTLSEAWSLSTSSKNNPKRKILYGSHEPVVMRALHMAARWAGIKWGSTHHSANPVMTTAIGVGSEKFAGSYENTEIAKIIRDMILAHKRTLEK